MKTPIKNSIRRFKLTVPILLTATFWITGCSAPKPAPDPLAGWKELLLTMDSKNLSPAIKNDFQEYLQSLSPRERDDARYVHFYEDGEGQHALRFEVPINGADWAYVLIYNKENQRIKVFKYISAYYRS